MSRIDTDVIANLSDEQITALQRWVEASEKAPGWLDGYGLGRSYIDTRTKGANYAARKAYVDLDHETAREVPELAGYDWRSIAEAVNDRIAASAAPRP